jgi:SAM-dependent methyltransferase
VTQNPLAPTPICPACRGGNLVQVERVDVAALAAVWSTQPHIAALMPAPQLLANLRADLGVSEVRIWRCLTCGLEHAQPMRTWTADHYPVQSHGFGFDQETAMRRLHGGTGRLLELGCGDGDFLARVPPLGYDVVGLDFAPTAVAAARARGLDVRQAGVSSLADAVRDRSPFNVLAMFQVIEHLEDPDAVFADLASLTCPGTRLMIGCPSPRRFGRAYAHPDRVGLSEFWDYPPTHTLRWTASALSAFLGRHGWEVVEVLEEPFDAVGAAAYFTAACGVPAGWYGHPIRRRLETARWRLRLALDHAATRYSGIRMFAEARAR